MRGRFVRRGIKGSHHRNPHAKCTAAVGGRRFRPYARVDCGCATSKLLFQLSESVPVIERSCTPASKLLYLLNLAQLQESRHSDLLGVQLPADPVLSCAYSALPNGNGAHRIIVLTQIALHISNAVNSEVKNTRSQQRICSCIEGGREIF